MSLLSGLRSTLPGGVSPSGAAPPDGTNAPKVPRAAPSRMADTALVFLEEPLARRLAVAWPACDDESTWLEVAGIPTGQMLDALRLCTALRANGICRDGGVTDELALQYIAALVSEPLRKAMNRENAKDGKRGRRR